MDKIWSGVTYKKGKEFVEFNPSSGLLDAPSMISKGSLGDFEIETWLTARALKCCITQVCGMIKAEVAKQRKRLYTLEKRRNEGASKTKLKKLVKSIKSNNPVKPFTGRINPELNSICCDFLESGGEFDGFLRLKSITKGKLTINIPIKYTRQSKKYSDRGHLLKSFLLTDKSINMRWEFAEPTLKTDGLVVGCDQGLKDVVTLSNGHKPNKEDIHGHSLDNILDKLSRKEKGSKAFKRAQNHRKNFVNWSINQLNLTDVKEVKFEEIKNINKGRSTSRKMSHWNNPEIRDKVIDKCLMEGVRFTPQSCTYRSQRCSSCGVVRKANRKGKLYTCNACGYVEDADLNASLNHIPNLPDIPYDLIGRGYNKGDGFLWNEHGIFVVDPLGEFTVPLYDKLNE